MLPSRVLVLPLSPSVGLVVAFASTALRVLLGAASSDERAVAIWLARRVVCPVAVMAGVMVVLFVLSDMTLLDAAAGDPWSKGVRRVCNAFTKRIGKGLALIAVVIAGLMFAFGEGGLEVRDGWVDLRGCDGSGSACVFHHPVFCGLAGHGVVPLGNCIVRRRLLAFRLMTKKDPQFFSVLQSASRLPAAWYDPGRSPTAFGPYVAASEHVVHHLHRAPEKVIASKSASGLRGRVVALFDLFGSSGGSR